MDRDRLSHLIMKYQPCRKGSQERRLNRILDSQWDRNRSRGLTPCKLYDDGGDNGNDGDGDYGTCVHLIYRIHCHLFHNRARNIGYINTRNIPLASCNSISMWFANHIERLTRKIWQTTLTIPRAFLSKKKWDVKYFILSTFTSGIPYFVTLHVPGACSLCPFDLHSEAYYCKGVNYL
jgi:hypothetical protein